MKILLAEDTKDMNRVLTVALEHEGYTVDSALDGLQASEFIEKNGYDVIVLDIMMPKKDGLQVLTDLRAAHITTPVLMLTAKAEIDDRVTGLDAGADDYLTKPFAMKELLARVRAMNRRKSDYNDDSVQEQSMVSYGDIILDNGSLEMRCENAVRLSNKEFELLSALISHQGEFLDTPYLLHHVWADSPKAQEDTVWLYIMYLKAKLKAVASNVVIEGEKGGSYRLTD